MSRDTELKIRFSGDLTDLKSALRQIGADLVDTKRSGQDAGKGISAGMGGIRGVIAEIRDNLKSLNANFAQAQAASTQARLAEATAASEQVRRLSEIRDRQREITAEVQRRAQAESDAAAREQARIRANAINEARIAANRADAIAAFSSATPDQLRTPAERQAAIGAEQTRRRDAELRMLEINRRADALEQRLAGTRRAAAQAQGQYAAQTARSAAAQRNLNQQIALAAPQLTDIAVSLASGQSPFLVAIQQGGQLRDIFGGIRPAIAGIRAAMGAVINPITIATAAAAALAIAFVKGQNEALKLNRILIQTGNSAGVTTDQIVGMAEALNRTVDGATQASASETLAAIAESGRFTADQFELVARASEQMRQSTGRDIGAIIGEFEKLAESPADAVVELNRKYNFLTGAILEQIRTLQEQGRQQEAATLAMRAYSEAVNSRTPAILENLGLIERGVRAIKNETREAISAILEIGRQQTGRQRFDTLFAERLSLQDDAARGNGFARERIKTIEAELRQLQDAEKVAQQKAAQQRAQSTAIRLSAELENEARQYDSAAEKRTRRRVSAINRANAAVEAAERAGDAKAAENAKRARDQIVGALDKEAADEAKREADAAARKGAAAAKRSATAAREAAREAANLVRIDAALVQDATQRSIQELQRLYAEGSVSVADYFAQRQRLETESIDAAIRAAEAQRDAAQGLDERKQAEAEILRLQRDRAEVATRAAREQAIAERELAAELQRLQARLAEANGALGEQQRVQLEQERDELLRKFQGNPGAQQLVRDLFDVELAKSRAAAIDAEREKIAGKLRDETDYLNSQSELGGLSPVDAELRLQEARQRTIDQLEELRRKAQEAYNQKPSEETLQALRQLDTEILQVKASQEAFKNTVKQQATDALSQFFTDLATGAKSFKDAFKDMVRGFIQGLARMAAEAIAKRIIFSIFGAAGGGGGSFLGSLFGGGGASVGTLHSGGMAGGGAKRFIPDTMFAPMFAAAPRYHDGGNVLKPGEVPAILQTGERVLNRRETQRYNAGEGSGGNVRVVNAFDPSFVPDQMDSAEGERVIFNVLGRNPGRVRQLLG